MNEPVICLLPAEMVKKKGISITEIGLCPVDYEPSAWQFKQNIGRQETIQQDILDFENLHSNDGKLLIIIPCKSQRLRLLMESGNWMRDRKEVFPLEDLFCRLKSLFSVMSC
jgi:hypothetical protein